MIETLVLVLVAWNAVQAVFFMRQIQKMTDKLMSRDFYDYQRGIKYEFPQPKAEAPTSIKLEEFDLTAPPNDLGF
jgi:hypothetical protein